MVILFYKAGDSLSYQVTKFSDIENKIIPFFTKFPILGVKFLDFSDFCQAVVKGWQIFT